MKDTGSILCQGSLIAEVKVCSKNNNHSSSIISSLRQCSSPNEKIRLKCVMKNSQLVQKKSPSKLLQKQNKSSRQQVNFDYFLFFYVDKHDNLEFSEYIKQVRISENTYSSNFTIVHDIEEFRAQFNEMKRTLCHKKFSLIVSQFALLNYRQQFKEIHQIHFFIPTQEKYSNLSFFMKQPNLKSILYDFQKLDKLLQDHNVLKKEIQQNKFPSFILVEKIKQIEIDKKTTFGSTGFKFNAKKVHNKQNSHTYDSQNSSSSYENELRVLKSSQTNFLRIPKSHNSSEKKSINLPCQSFLHEGIKTNEKHIKFIKEQNVKGKKKSNLTWFRNYSKATSESNKHRNQLNSIYQDQIIENSLYQSVQNDKQGRFSKTEDTFYRRNKNNTNF